MVLDGFSGYPIGFDVFFHPFFRRLSPCQRSGTSTKGPGDCHGPSRGLVLVGTVTQVPRKSRKRTEPFGRPWFSLVLTVSCFCTFLETFILRMWLHVSFWCSKMCLTAGDSWRVLAEPPRIRCDICVVLTWHGELEPLPAIFGRKMIQGRLHSASFCWGIWAVMEFVFT